MKKIIEKMRDVVQVILLAPIRLPQKVSSGVRYAAWLLGIADYILDNPPPKDEEDKETEKDNIEEV